MVSKGNFKYQLKCRLLNYGANITDFLTNKRFLLWFVVVLIITSFVCGFMFKYNEIKAELAWQQYLKMSQESVEKDKVITKVKFIMNLYNCDSLVIYESLMDTFNPVLMAILVGIESEYNPKAISCANALGLTQCTPDKFKKGEKWDDPETNIRVGAAFLQTLIKQFGDEKLALAGYNAGPYAVIRCGYQIPVTKNNETANYIVNANKLGNLISNLR